MNNDSNDRSVKLLGVLTLAGLLAVGAVYTLMGKPSRAGGRSVEARMLSRAAAQDQTQTQQPRPGRPVPPARSGDRPAPQIYHPAELAKLLSSGNKPTVVSISSRAVFDSAHIPEALFHGAASTREGLKDLKQWAEGVPKTSEIVLYCGCCPMEESPNIRPAIKTLREMGFTHVHVLWLEHDFQTDWVAKGYPAEKGK